MGSFQTNNITTHCVLSEIRGYEGKDVTIPCFAPSYLNSPVLHWNFSNSDEPRHILSYDVRTGRSVSSSSWEGHVELDAYRVQFGDGSLRLMDPSNKEHTGSYTCVFTTPFNVHMERSDVTISGTGQDPDHTLLQTTRTADMFMYTE